MTDVLDERAHIQALIAALKEPLGQELNGDHRIYDFGTVPGADGNAGQLPNIYVLVSVERRYGAPNKSGRSTGTGWRASLRYVGRTVDEARAAASHISGTLNEQRLTVAGVESTLITHESTSAIAPDSGRFSGLMSWTYVL